MSDRLLTALTYIAEPDYMCRILGDPDAACGRCRAALESFTRHHYVWEAGGLICSFCLTVEEAERVAVAIPEGLALDPRLTVVVKFAAGDGIQ